MAALTAGRAGARVILADEDFLPGGRLNAERLEVGGRPGADWAAAVAAELAALPNVRVMPRTTVTGAYDGGTYGALERVAEHVARAAAGRRCSASGGSRRGGRCSAPGAIERPLAFRGQRPAGGDAGRGGAGLPQPLGGGAAAGGGLHRPTTTAGARRRTSPRRGSRSRRSSTPRPGAPLPAGPWRELRRRRGRRRARAARACARSACGAEGASRAASRSDCLAVAGGWNPTLHLTCHLGARPVWDEALAAFVPADGRGAGAGGGRGGGGRVLDAGGARRRGARRRPRRSRELGIAAPAPEVPRGGGRAGARSRRFWQVAGGRGRAWLDFQNDVTVKDVALAAREGFRSVEHMKRYTTLGMATDQGKTGGVAGARRAGRADRARRRRDRDDDLPAAVRAGADRGARGRRRRRGLRAAALHAGARGDRGDGRAAASRRGSGTGRAGSRRRARPRWRAGLRPRGRRWCASAVGVCDVTTLGKIDVQGPDAAAFLDRVYANTISTLRGRAGALRAHAARGRLRHGRRHRGAARRERTSSSPPRRRRPAR